MLRTCLWDGESKEIAMTEKTCIWTLDMDDWNAWKPSCGSDLFVLNEGTPAENKMKFCPYCAKPIEAPVENVDQEEADRG